MSSLSLIVQVVILLITVHSALSVTIPSHNETALWKLYHYAVQSRSTYPYPYHHKYPEYYQEHLFKQYPGSTYVSSHNNNNPDPYENYLPYKQSHIARPNGFGTYADLLHHFSNSKESLIDILHSIARNDDLQCVPKLICEVASGTISGRQQGLSLPVNVNMESLLSFLASLNGVQTSPLLYFGQAALLGLASKDDRRKCNHAYPECPTDPDKVVKYLNNHNGGFFRFFNKDLASANTQQIYQQVPPWRKKQFAEQRIQNSAVGYTPDNLKHPNSITFPVEENVLPHIYRFGKVLKFPKHEVIPNNELSQNTVLYSPYTDFRFPTDNYEHFLKTPEESDYNYLNPVTDFQKPLPNHQASPVIYPVRTGTGDLRLDPEELQDFKKTVYYQDDDVKVVFNGINSDDLGYIKKGRGFSFPQL